MSDKEYTLPCGVLPEDPLPHETRRFLLREREQLLTRLAQAERERDEALREIARKDVLLEAHNTHEDLMMQERVRAERERDEARHFHGNEMKDRMKAEARAERLRLSLTRISAMPCIHELLGEPADDCGCARCEARAALAEEKR